MTSTERKIAEWLVAGETGSSSIAIAARFLGVVPRHGWQCSHPSDPDDFKRCLKLIRAIPEIGGWLKEMREVSPYWKALIDNWQEVENSFMHEVPEWLDGGGMWKCAPETFKIMRRIFDAVFLKTKKDE